MSGAGEGPLFPMQGSVALALLGRVRPTSEEEGRKQLELRARAQLN